MQRLRRILFAVLIFALVAPVSPAINIAAAADGPTISAGCHCDAGCDAAACQVSGCTLACAVAGSGSLLAQPGFAFDAPKLTSPPARVDILARGLVWPPPLQPPTA